MSATEDLAILRQFFRYNPETGVVTWAKAHGKKIKADDIAGSKAKGRHIDLRVGAFRCKAHYAAWLLHYGRSPVGEIDHRNTIRNDNRIGNLRDATRSQNGANKPRQRNNTSGYKGVSLFKQTGRWQAYINVDGARKHLGFFSAADEAAAAYDAAASAAFGEFARLNLAPVIIEREVPVTVAAAGASPALTSIAAAQVANANKGENDVAPPLAHAPEQPGNDHGSVNPPDAGGAHASEISVAA